MVVAIRDDDAALLINCNSLRITELAISLSLRAELEQHQPITHKGSSQDRAREIVLRQINASEVCSR